MSSLCALPTRTKGLLGLFKGTSNLPKQVGVSTYLALTFGTLLSSQGTDASFVLTLSGFPPGFSFGISCFRLYQTLSCPIPRRRGVSFRLFGRSDVPNSSGYPGRLIIEPVH